MDPVGLGIKIAPSGALVEDNPLETQRELAEQEAPEARHQQLLAGREVSRPSYEDAGTHHVKAREQPVRAFTALRVAAGVGGARLRVGLEPPFVGRDREFGLVVESATDSAERGVAGLVA